ncbi:unnamed protein product [Peronospora belbahrii]|uniref:Uncharacterized protein n=1 Tax=Peronospora belbahrii TaxID=622444 RepID=A0AAU9KTH2_9STRA|nr:unnamed protein product [Peronospora belbahrii]
MGATAAEQVVTTPDEEAVTANVVKLATQLEWWLEINHSTARVMKYVRDKWINLFGSKTSNEWPSQWIKYIKLYNEQHPVDVINPAETIMKLYNDEALVQYVNQLPESTSNSGTRALVEIDDEVFHEMKLDMPLLNMLLILND